QAGVPATGYTGSHSSGNGATAAGVACWRPSKGLVRVSQQRRAVARRARRHSEIGCASLGRFFTHTQTGPHFEAARTWAITVVLDSGAWHGGGSCRHAFGL